MSLRSIRATLANSPYVLHAAKLGKSRVDLFIGREATLGGVAQPAIDAGKLGRCRLVVAFAQTFVDVARDFGQLVLRMGGPCFDTFQDLGQALGFHVCIIVGFVGWAKRSVPTKRHFGSDGF